MVQLHNCTDNDVNQRLLHKITESNGEKLDRCSELCAKYAKMLLASEKQIESTAEALKVMKKFNKTDFNFIQFYFV